MKIDKIDMKLCPSEKTLKEWVEGLKETVADTILIVACPHDKFKGIDITSNSVYSDLFFSR